MFTRGSLLVCYILNDVTIYQIFARTNCKAVRKQWKRLERCSMIAAFHETVSSKTNKEEKRKIYREIRKISLKFQNKRLKILGTRSYVTTANVE